MTTCPIDERIALQDRMTDYCYAVDKLDNLEDLLDLFTEDATWTRENSPPVSMGGSGLPRETISRAALGALMTEVMQKKFRQRMHHQFTDFYVEPGANADEAHGHARALITDWRDGPGKFAMFGKYTMVFARTTDGWRIRSASVYVLPDGL